MSDTTPGTAPVEEKTAANTTPAAKTTTTEPKAKTAAKAKAEPKTADTKTTAKADEKADEQPELTIKVKNTGVTLLETRTGTMLESGKTTTIKVNDEVTRSQVLKNIEQLNYLHGDTLDVK